MKLREIRAMRGLSGRQLAKLAGIDNSQLARIEKGYKPNVTVKTIMGLARALDVPEETMFTVMMDEFLSTDMGQELSAELKAMEE